MAITLGRVRTILTDGDPLLATPSEPATIEQEAPLFSDLGNIWNVWDSQQDPAAIFTGFSSLQDIAWGTGFGLRYDFTYFIFRADLGFKTYNPGEVPGKRWFRDYNFANAVFQIGINYPF